MKQAVAELLLDKRALQAVGVMRSETVVSERRAGGASEGTSGDMPVRQPKGPRSAFAGAVARAGGDPATGRLSAAQRS
jgi:hypothetical protein